MAELRSRHFFARTRIMAQAFSCARAARICPNGSERIRMDPELFMGLAFLKALLPPSILYHTQRNMSIVFSKKFFDLMRPGAIERLCDPKNERIRFGSGRGERPEPPGRPLWRAKVLKWPGPPWIAAAREKKFKKV